MTLKSGERLARLAIYLLISIYYLLLFISIYIYLLISVTGFTKEISLE